MIDKLETEISTEVNICRTHYIQFSISASSICNIEREVISNDETHKTTNVCWFVHSFVGYARMCAMP